MKSTIQSDHHSLIELWVNQFSDELYRWAIFKVSDEAIAQDLVQETFISAFQHAERFREASSPKTWLFAILKNKIIDHYRKKVTSSAADDVSEAEPDQWFDSNDQWKAEKKPAAWNLETENLLDNPEFEATLNKCLGQLPVNWLGCIQLKYLNEKDSESICQELNITTSNFWQIIHRAKLQLRNCLEKYWFNT